MITREVSPWIANKGWMTGLDYVVPFCSASRQGNATLREALADKEKPPKIENVTVDGEDLVSVNLSPDRFVNEVFLLDPKHGYALREHRFGYVSADPKAVGYLQRWQVTGYVDAGDGVCLPKEAEYTTSDKGVVDTRTTFQITAARVVQERTLKELVEIDIPAGWKVEDKRTKAEIE